ncbi:glutathione hydrolase 1 proenzyme [Agrilus planipennis]|uniref:Glutathione hydrolase 1 proenzyme n=1 Tax=Agrilus planipennis TaxID=224129 RepID=A0A7F5R8V0_AGRPL|nr:glutathione hydrolase 1 proenzyme [Agrilus planipennis]
MIQLSKAKYVGLGGVGLTGLVVLVTYVSLYSSVKPSHYVAAVVTNGYECSQIGASILEQGGSAVDSAIAALFCEGIAMPQSMGLGGGFFMTIYIREEKTAYYLNARESAPLAASRNMFAGNASLSAGGGLAVAVPGELKGYWYAHQKFGKLPWATLIQPSIELCRRGHLVTPYLANLFNNQKNMIRQSDTLREIFFNPETNDVYKEGDYVKRLKLAETLEVIAEEGADALYDGSLTSGFIQDIKDLGGIIVEEDLKIYTPLWEDPAHTNLNGYSLYTSRLPSAGGILTFILNILQGYLDHNNINSVKNWQRIVEAFKYGYARRTDVGDPRFVDGMDTLMDNLMSTDYANSIRSLITDDKTFQNPVHYGVNASFFEDHGTAHLSVLAENGDAVSVTSTINLYFGAKIRSRSTGIILNDEMDDFSSPNITNSFNLPPMPNNFIEPQKRPASSMAPSIIVNEKGDVKLIVGAAGGSKITTAVALVAMRNLWFAEEIQEAVSAPRLHHQLFPMSVAIENDFDPEIIKGLAAIGHNYTLNPATGFSALTAISVDDNGVVTGGTDPRRSGTIAYVSAKGS